MKEQKSIRDTFDSMAESMLGGGSAKKQRQDSPRIVRLERNTKETHIRLELSLDEASEPQLSLGLPFFEHMLRAMAFHGGFGLNIEGKGDTDVDPHHLVEDVGLVLGSALHEALERFGAVQRYGWALIPMDDALSEAAIDVCRRPYLVYDAAYPQSHSGDFDMSLFREFFQALANRAQINLHLHCRYGHNSHHMSESLFKALGKTIAMAYRSADSNLASMSTKGAL